MAKRIRANGSPCYYRDVAEYGELASTSHISKMVLSIVKLGEAGVLELSTSILWGAGPSY